MQRSNIYVPTNFLEKLKKICPSNIAYYKFLDRLLDKHCEEEVNQRD